MNQTRAAQDNEEAWQDRLSLPLLLLLGLFVTRLTRYTRAKWFLYGDPAGGGGEAFDLDPSKVFVALIGAVFVAAVLLWPRRRVIRIDLAAGVLLVFAVYLLLTVFWAYAPRVSLNWTLITFQWFLLYLPIISWTLTRGDLHRWGTVMLIGSFIVLGAMVMEWQGVAPERLGGARPGSAVYAYWEIYPRWAVMFLPFAMHYALKGQSSLLRKVGATAIAANLVTVYLSWRRAGPFVAAFALVAYTLLAGRRRLLVGIAATIGITATMLLTINPRYVQRITDLPGLGGATLEHWEVDTRMFQYMVGIQTFVRYPIGGAGQMGSREWGADQYGRTMTQHCLTLALLAEAGIIGLFIFGLFAFVPLRRCLGALRACRRRRNKHDESWCAAVIASLLTILLWAQMQPLLRALPIYLLAALASSTTEILRGAQADRFSSCEDADGSRIRRK